MRAPLDSPLMADFVAAPDPINALADDAPGFVWRLATEQGNATSIRAFDDDALIVNMHLGAHGPTPFAVTFKSQFRAGVRLLIDEDIGCPA